MKLRVNQLLPCVLSIIINVHIDVWNVKYEDMFV